MAKIYAAWEGKQPIRTPPVEELPFPKVIPLLNTQQHIWSDKPETFGVQGSDPRLDDVRDASAIYIEVSDQEAATTTGWRGGWYFMMIAPSLAKKLLGL